MKKLILFFLLFALVPVVYASPQLTFADMTLTAFKDNPTIFWLNITNTGNDTMYNVTCENKDSIIFSTLDSIAPTASSSLKLTILTSQTFTGRLTNTKCSFLYKQMTDFPIKTWAITYNGTFQPYQTDASIGDSVQITNLLNTSIKMKEINNLFAEFDIQPSQSSGFPIIANQQYIYYNFYSGTSGVINPLNRSREVLVHSPDYDKSLIINLDSIFENAQISIDTYETSFSLSPFDSKESVIKVTNTGNYPAININLSMQWAKFYYQGSEITTFGLNANESRFINFIITPEINTTEQTGITYPLILKAVSPNIAEVDKNIAVSISYYNMSILSPYQGHTLVFVVNVPYTIEYCRQNENASECQPLYKNFTRYQILEKYVNTNISWTPDQLQRITECIADGNCFIRMTNILTEFSNQTEEKMNDMQTKVDNLEANGLTASQVQAEFDEYQKRTRNNWYFVITIAMFILIGTGTFLWTNKMKKNAQANQSEYA